MMVLIILSQLWVKVWPSLFYAVRVSFGLALVLSIVLIFTTIAVAGSASVSTYVCEAPSSLGQIMGNMWCLD